MKTIRRFGNIANAGFAQSLLEAIGIDAALADERAFALGPQYVPWGIRLQVPEPDVEKAEGVLDRQEGFLPIDDDFVPPPLSAEEAGRIPPRGGSDIGAFLLGGFFAIIVFGFYVAIAFPPRSKSHPSFESLMLIFAFGGAAGTCVRARQVKEGKDGSPGGKDE